MTKPINKVIIYLGAVVDLRLKVRRTKTEKTVYTCIIIVEATVDEETMVLGALVHSVQNEEKL